MTKNPFIRVLFFLTCASTVALVQPVCGQQLATKAQHVIKDGQAQIVAAFKNRNEWIRENLWVETEIDTDGDGKLDRVHVDVTRPGQTQSEGLKVPVVYESSPYYSGTGNTSPQFMWNPKHELNGTPPERKSPPAIAHQGTKTRISTSLIRQWVRRGFAVVHSCSPGTGRSQGCPTVGGKNESLAPKAVIDWLNGRAKGYTHQTVLRKWSRIGVPVKWE